MENSRRPLVAGNWKMNNSLSDAKKLAASIASYAGDYDHVDFVIAPVSTALLTAHEAIKGKKVGLAAQNMHFASHGAFTGELSSDMIKDCGCEWVILGHSERRQYFGETDELVNRKTIAALLAGLHPIICVGESLAERKSEWMKNKISLQVRSALSGVCNVNIKKVTIAYEPIWAIGTGETATPDQAEEVHSLIRELLTDMYDAEIAAHLRILYGGSVKKDNIKSLIEQPDIDGALIGGASLDADHFKEIGSICNEYAS